MILKVNRIKAIGKFRDYSAAGDVAFRKLTLIYADNGSGKTTLTSVFRSASIPDAEIIKRRWSTNQLTVPQEAEITEHRSSGNVLHIYRPSGWNSQFLNIEVFDTEFVNENIYSGFDFTDDHKKQLYQFVIGAQGVAIQQQIEQNKSDKTDARRTIESLEQQLLSQVGNGIILQMIPSFVSIPLLPPTIDEQITTAETALANANSNAVIQTLQSLGKIPEISPTINFESIIADLQTTSQTIGDETLKELFSSHCDDLRVNKISSPENWLQLGFNYVEEKRKGLSDSNNIAIECPFCKRTIESTSNILNAYGQKFNDVFNTFISRLQAHQTSVAAFNLESIQQRINQILQGNASAIASWSSHLPSTTIVPSITVSNDEAILKAELQALIVVITQKVQNPSIAINPSTVETFRNSISLINTRIERYNREADAYIQAIYRFRGSIKTISQAQDDLNKLRRIKKRFDQQVVSTCASLQAEKLRLRNLDNAYPQLIRQQEAAATAFFSNYKDRINYYLETVFRTPFKIDNVTHVPPQGRGTQSRMSYQLTIDNQPISFDRSRQHNAKDCLSEGDKSTLALAFFFSKLDIDQTIGYKIIVFDDPLSSFDRNRRMYTVQLIRDLLNRSRQVVVLSHNEQFLYELSKLTEAGNKKELWIKLSENSLSSTIEEVSLESMIEKEYFKQLNALHKFLLNPQLDRKDEVLRLMRNVLEAHLLFKFYRQTSALQRTNRTLGTIIRTIVASGVSFKDANRTDVINKLNLINGVSSPSHHGNPDASPGISGVDPSTITITELSNLVRDTFDLIETRL